MNKVIIIGILLLVIIGGLFLLNGNSSDRNTENKTDKIIALSTFTIIADMVSEVGGDRVESISLTKPGAEIHGYEPTPGDLVGASKAEVIFENGMNLELWTTKLKASLPNVPVVTISEGIEVVSIVEGTYEGKPNPHAWMSPKQGLVYVENIRKTLTELAPEQAAYFQANADDYSEKLRQLDVELAEALAVLSLDQRYLVTCEGAFTYLTNDYNLSEIYLWAINDESGGSPQQVAKVINLVKQNQIPTVFCESTVESGIQREVANASGASLGGVLYVDSLSEADGPAPTYLALLEHTVNTIIGGLVKN